MPPKDRSTTILSKSSTSRGSSPTNHSSENTDHTPIQFAKGVGPRLAALFKSREIETVRDLFYFLPRSYEDRSQFVSVAELAEGAKTTLTVTVLGQRQIRIQKLGRSLLEVRCQDETGELSLKWFHAPYGIEKRLLSGVRITVTGKVKFYQGRPEIVHPEIHWGSSASAAPRTQVATAGPATGPGVGSEKADAAIPHLGRVIPVYTEIEGVSTRTLRKILWDALEKFGSTLQEDLPQHFLDRHRLPLLPQAIREIHFPPKELDAQMEALSEFDTPAHHRLIYGEFFKFEYLMLRRKLRMEKSRSQSFGFSEGRARVEHLKSKLPFQLTRGQEQAIDEILEDLLQTHPMNRLVQGDVGSGKTVVAFLTAACVLTEGAQAALMVPTEILAEQHFKNAQKMLGGNLNVALLTGKTSAAERTQLLNRLAEGEPLLLIGTHALLEDPVSFSRLSYVMIDEQHRFGVEQRKTLRLKGLQKDATGQSLLPHCLILTATPIPRTLALTAFGDLSVSTMTELPPGRSPVQTKVVRDRDQRSQAFRMIEQELLRGKQAYFIYPLVNESEAEGFTQLKSATAEAEYLANEVFPGFRVGLLHGKLKPDEKASIMEKFKQGEVRVLVSTTVVEVGVDVPNATVIVIEHAERFGLSQLHQLRGRVGRGKDQSYCFLFSHVNAGGTSAERLEVLEETQDGFKIAEADLTIRGPGEFLGTRQAGGLPFKMANLVRDREWLLRARDDVMEMIRQDPELTLPENRRLRDYYEREGGIQFERLKTG